MRAGGFQFDGGVEGENGERFGGLAVDGGAPARVEGLLEDHVALGTALWDFYRGAEDHVGIGGLGQDSW